MMTKKLGYVALLSIASASAAMAADSLPAPGKLTVGGVKVRALVDSYYQYNFNRPGLSTTGQSGTPQASFRAYDSVHRAFDINQATIGLSYDASPVGFDVRLGVGSQLERLNAGAGASETTYQHIRAATATWKPGKFHMSVGRYDVDFGMERIDSVDNWNYSRSLIFTNNSPRFMTGLNMGYDFGSGMSALFGYGNGVDRYLDNNKSGSYLGKFMYDMGSTNLGLSYLMSPERFDMGTQFRHYVSLTATHKYSDNFSVGAEASFVRGQNETVGPATVALKGSSTYGAALYASGSFFKDNTESFRAEWLQDADGRVTLRNAGTTFWSFTGTHRYKVSQNMSLLGELRWDHANRDRFFNTALQNTRDNQVTLTAAATFNI